METLHGFQMRRWPGQPRKTIDPKKIAELAANIKEVGVLQALCVRKLAKPEGDVTHEVIFGERRMLAVQLLEETHKAVVDVPVNVREIGDGEALELALTENAQREGVSPLEEAEAIELLIKKHGRTVEHVIAKLGHPAPWVNQRMRLLKLGMNARNAFVAGRFLLGHALLLSALDEKAQDAIIKEHGNYEFPSIGGLRQTIERSLHRLIRAPFDVKSDQLSPGPCTACPKRTGTQPDLFGQVTSNDDSCMDTPCWTAKSDQHWKIESEKAKKEKLPIVPAKKVLEQWGSIKRDSDYATTDDKVAKKKGLEPVAITRGKDGETVKLYDKKAVQKIERVETSDTTKKWREQQSKQQREWKEKKEKAAAARYALVTAMRAVLRKDVGKVARAVLVNSLSGGDRDEIEIALLNQGVAPGAFEKATPEQAIFALIESAAIDAIHHGHDYSGKQNPGLKAFLSALAIEPKPDAAAKRTLSVFSDQWVQHKTGLLDEKGLGLANRWKEVGATRQVTLYPGAEMDRVLAYAKIKNLSITVDAASKSPAPAPKKSTAKPAPKKTAKKSRAA